MQYVGPKIITVRVPGPQGPAGPSGSQGIPGPSGSDAAVVGYTTTASFNEFTSSYKTDSSSFDSRITGLSQSFTGLSSSYTQFIGDYSTGSFTGSFVGDGSGLVDIPASGIIGLVLSQIISGSYSASISETGLASNVPVIAFSFTGSLFGTASQALQAQSSSYALTASYASNVPLTASYAIQAQSSSYALTASYSENSKSASYSDTALSASFATTALFAPDYLPLTGGLITGSIEIVGNLTVYGSSSFVYITASQLAVSSSTISVNIFEPAQRFGGLVVYDSGSTSHQATSSLLWDSLNNKWIYQNASGSAYDGGGLISGPRNTGSLGDQTYPTLNAVVRGQGGDHIYDSNIYDDDIQVSIHIDTNITGSLFVSQGITGSIHGTSSWSENSISSSYSLLATTASYWSGSVEVAASASFALTASYVDFTDVPAVSLFNYYNFI